VPGKRTNRTSKVLVRDLSDYATNQELTLDFGLTRLIVAR